MTKKIGMRTIKTAVGATIAIILANLFGLKYALSAGVITILSVQNTKRKSVEIAWSRFNSTCLALMISGILFSLIGFNAFAFGLYLLIFIPLAVSYKLSDGIVMSSVLVTHLLGEGYISLSLIANEFFLVIIGAGIAILFNLYMPKMQPRIKEDQVKIEEQFRIVLLCLAGTTSSQSVAIDEEFLFQTLEEMLLKARDRAMLHKENYLLDEMTYYVQYMDMRFMQYQVLLSMRQTLGKVVMTVEQSSLIADLTEHIAFNLHEYNPAEDLIQMTQDVLTQCRNQELPKTREEFENRALLFQYLNDLQYLLEIKRHFVQNLTEQQRLKFGLQSL
ncbi:aromatic acid exporter family protein [Turicibacter sanguinis]|uniref:aromatic acid exporter family protein n=1 Tax=Turicibacter sanguinis TaxID=154288 RepID=UPI0018A9975B|nr:aromatic acid exporter family protein [Turicibacter sanguinis]MDB8553010.1 aromatic acid exporter family protein [Turicibacter sanguinis]